MAVAMADVWEQLPLAEAFWLLWKEALPDSALDEFFDEHWGRYYERCFAFSDLVHLVNDALCQHQGRAHATLSRHAESERCPASEEAFYGKLRRVPIELSDRLVDWAAQRLRPWRSAVPAPNGLASCFSALRVLVFDGKTLKGASKRLKPLRRLPGAAIGGRVLGVLDLASGLVVGMSSHPHGHVNEQVMVSDALAHVRERVRGPRLWVADRQFGNLANFKRCTHGGDHCVLRKHIRSVFQADPEQPVRTGVDAEGRSWTDEVGTLRSSREGEQAARQITLRRENDADLVLLTSLTDAQAYPASDILELYRQRWDIEEMYQKVSEVFQLKHLIGAHPQAMIFQTALCLTLANVLTVLRTLLARSQRRAVETVSVAQVWYDLQRQLTSSYVLASPDAISDAVGNRARAVVDLRAHLQRILAAGWTDRWIKAPPKKRHLPKVKHRRGGKAHFSTYAVLQQHAQSTT
jgi:hypothetical protein